MQRYLTMTLVLPIRGDRNVTQTTISRLRTAALEFIDAAVKYGVPISKTGEGLAMSLSYDYNQFTHEEDLRRVPRKVSRRKLA